MRLIQLVDEDGATRVGEVDAGGAQVRLLEGPASMHALATAAIDAGRSLDAEVAALPGDTRLDYAALLREGACWFRCTTPIRRTAG